MNRNKIHIEYDLIIEDLHMAILKYRKINMAAVLFFGSINLGCGGGGGSSDSADDSIGEFTGELIPVMDPTPTVVGVNTSELIAEKDFLFNSTGSLNIDVNIQDLEYIRAYINVCYIKDNLDIDYKNCVVNAPLKNGKIQSEIELANDVEVLYMEIWQYGIDEKPLGAVWHRADGMVWNVML